MLQDEDCHLALSMTMCQCWHKLKRLWRMARQALPTPHPHPPGLEGKAVQKDTGKDNVGDRPVKGGGGEPPQMVVTVFTRCAFH